MSENKTKNKSNREGTGKKHPCKNCGYEIPTYKKFCNRECYNQHSRIIIKCECCGKEKSLPKNRKGEKFCSIQCANKSINRKETRKKAINTLKNKYDVENPFEVQGYNNLDINRNGKKISKTYHNKTSKEKDLIKSKISKSNKNKTTKEKNIIKQKREQTNLNRYGVKSTLQSNSPLRNKADINNKNSQKNKYDKWLKNNNLELQSEYKGVKDNEGNIIYYEFKHIPSGNIFVDHLACGRLPIYKDPNETIGISNMEKDLISFIENNYTGKIITNNRKLVKGFEIDIFLPEINLAIEFNGLFWHSELKGKTRLYHLNKTQECEKQNIQLIHVFEDEWMYQKEIIKSRILNLLRKTPNKIYARKCIIKSINNNIKNKFLNDNHIQGEDKSKFKYGLYYNNELVSIITFGKLRKVTGNISKDNQYELIRFCNKLNTNVIGGFSKLLKHFIKQESPQKIISYADRRWSIGNVYEKNGFNFIHNTSPNYWYMKYYKQREHRFKYIKSNLPNILPNFNPMLSEWENMKNNKYDRIWDCGSKKYEYNLS